MAPGVVKGEWVSLPTSGPQLLSHINRCFRYGVRKRTEPEELASLACLTLGRQ